MQIEAEV
jgi:hypothetical protein